MRLFRRTLLCLVVGVTAFGAAGWGLRPKPKWSLNLDPTSEWSFIGGEPQRYHDGLMWLHRAPGEEADELTAISRTDGVLRWTVPLKFDEKRGAERAWDLPPNDRVHALVLPDGEVAIHRWSREGDNSCIDEFFRVHLNSGPEVRRFTLDDWWVPTPDWAHAWRVDWGGTFTLCDAGTGAVERTLKFGPEYKRLDGSVVLAPDARTLAVAEGGHVASHAGAGVELWDVAKGRLVRRLTPPRFGAGSRQRNAPRLVAESPLFLAYGNVLTWSLVDRSNDESVHHRKRKGDRDQVYFDLSADRFVERTQVPSPRPEAGGVVNLHDERAGSQAWVYMGSEPTDEALLWVRHSPSEAPAWGRIPYQLFNSEPLRDASDWTGLTVHLVNGSIVARMREASPLAAVPDAVAHLAPATWGEPVERYRWHKLGTSAWRDVGCRGRTLDHQVRSDALNTITSSDDGSCLLQSWPLPPRDPKPPALAIAGLCMAGAWWLCAWRYRRRMRLAAVGAV